MNRRLSLLWAAATATTAIGTLGGCASRSEPTRWYELRSEPPVALTIPPLPPLAQGGVWEVPRSVRMPGALDRDVLQRARGQASLEPLVGHRWAAPLRDSVPRVLLHDLAVLRGSSRVWAAPAPPDVAVEHRLRVELLTWQATARERVLRLQALWWLEPVAGPGAMPLRAAPRPRRVDLGVTLADDSVDALAAAHRLALWRLAEQIASAPLEDAP
jgi:uncharacterized lipoprotein YmbA